MLKTFESYPVTEHNFKHWPHRIELLPSTGRQLQNKLLKLCVSYLKPT
jgi:hypothetical protein